MNLSHVLIRMRNKDENKTSPTAHGRSGPIPTLYHGIFGRILALALALALASSKYIYIVNDSPPALQSNHSRPKETCWAGS